MKTDQSGKDVEADSSRLVPPSRYALFALITLVGLTADLWTKSWIFEKLRAGGPGYVQWLWDGQVGFELSLNQGALFGIGQGWIPLFVVLSVVAAVGIVLWLFVAGEARSQWLTVALACVMAGIFGNLYDRLGLHGLNDASGERIYAVRDWILFQWNRDYRWPNFNLADSLLVCGAIMLVVHAFLTPATGEEQPTVAKHVQRKAS